MSIIQGFIAGVSNTNNVRYTIVPNYTYIDEGGTASAQTVTYAITTTGVDDGTVLYWDNAGTTVAADIGGSNTGSVTISGSSATISLTATSDNTTEGTETIIIRLYKDSGRTHLVATAATVTVGDTSLDPPIPGSALFTDSESDNMVLAPTGSYGGSAQFSGSNYLSVAGNAGTAMGTGDFTWETWVYPASSADYQCFIDTRTNPLTGGDTTGFYFGTNTGTLTPMYYTTGIQLVSSINITLNTWNHVALTRASGTVTIWVNGASGGTKSDTTDLTQQRVFIGGTSDGGNTGLLLTGGISNLRIVKGTAVYTGNFTPATTPLAATQRNGGYSAGANIVAIESGTELLLLTVTSPNLLVDSSGNSRTVTNNNGVSFASTTPVVYYDFDLGDTYTLEWWMNSPVASTSQQGILGQGGWIGGLVNETIMTALCGGDLVISQGDTNTECHFTEPTPGEWTHVAVVTTSGVSKVYYNGILQTKTAGSYRSHSLTNIRQPLYIGRLAPPYGCYFKGKLTNIRITDTAIYSANFSPPYTQPTIVGGHTKLLWAPTQYSTTTDGGDHATAITNNGATANTDYPQPITHGSAAFDNAPRHIAVTDASHFGFGTTWTVEWWQKADTSTVSGNLLTILCQGPGNINSGQFDIFCQNGNLYVGNGNSIGAEPAPSVWTHVALVSNSGVLTVYYNGVQQFSSLINYSITNTTDALYIGRRGPSVGGQNFRGKLTNVHIINTADKYTAAFIPAVLPLKITGTVLLWAPTNRGIVADTSNYAQTLTNTSATYSTEYPNEFAYEAIHPHSGAGILTMTKSINGLSVQAGATNFDDTPPRGSYITIDGVTVASDYTIGVGVNMTRGHTMVVVNKETNQIESINVYDTWESPTVIETPLSIVPNGRIVILVTYDATSCTSNMRNTLVNSYGASTPGSYATWTTERVSQLFIGVKR